VRRLAVARERALRDRSEIERGLGVPAPAQPLEAPREPTGADEDVRYRE